MIQTKADLNFRQESSHSNVFPPTCSKGVSGVSSFSSSENLIFSSLTSSSSLRSVGRSAFVVFVALAGVVLLLFTSKVSWARAFCWNLREPMYHHGLTQDCRKCCHNENYVLAAAGPLLSFILHCQSTNLRSVQDFIAKLNSSKVHKYFMDNSFQQF